MIKEQLKKITPFQWFIIKALALYLIWVLLFRPWVDAPGNLSDQMTMYTGEVSAWVIERFGYESFIKQQAHPGDDYLTTVLYIDQAAVVSIADACNALVIIILYVGFIIAYPGVWKTKVPFIILGILAVFTVNIVRVTALAFNMMYHRASFDFNHKYTFTFMVYLIVFILWMVWANKYSSVKFQHNKAT